MVGQVFRIGHGWDLHRTVAGRKCIIGGVDIPHSLGLAGHSDADVLLHAITDALLGAVAAGDIGRLFPDNDERWRDADSSVLLAEAWSQIRGQGWLIVNLDCTVIAQQPKLAPHIRAIEQRISQILGVEPSQCSVKAKTSEGVGEIGRNEAVAAHCVVLVSRESGF